MPSQTIKFTPPDPENPEQMSQAIGEIQQLLDGGVSFGHPQDPADDTSTTLAGAGGASAGHNGTLANINGSWVEQSITALGQQTFYHNLNLDVFSASNPNVRWFIAGMSHDGTDGGAGNLTGAAVSVIYKEGGTVAADSIQLHVGGTGITVAAGTPLTLTLFFLPALRFDGA